LEQQNLRNEESLLDSEWISAPFISVIIPTRNEEKYIVACLDSLVLQTYPKDKFEVLLIDGLSNDKTIDLAKNYLEHLNLRILCNLQEKHVVAFNYGIKEAKGKYFIILGGHSFVENDFIEKNVKTFFKIAKKENKLAAVGGSLEAISENSCSVLVSSLFGSWFSGSSSFWYSDSPHFDKTVPFGFYEKSIIEKIGYFDESFIKGQDFELNLRLNKRGYKVFHEPKIKSNYYVRNTLTGFLKQSFDNGVAKGLCAKKYFNPLLFFPVAFLLYQTLFAASFFLFNISTIPLLLPLIVYWILNIIASAKASKGKKLFLLPLMFWVLHNVTGIGISAGLIIGKKSIRL
jgi:dolichyl N-acetyl-alpha-D-glucosaminyl phosphate 3-beta-D-2,3-diacetamido-2,3-dideoxy-beta-D-glucuronosyltransferase